MVKINGHSNTWFFTITSFKKNCLLQQNPFVSTSTKLKYYHLDFIHPDFSKRLRSRPKKTAETIDEDDWIHTGDIGLFISVKIVQETLTTDPKTAVPEFISYNCFLSNDVFSLLFYFTKLKSHSLKVSHLNLRIQKNNSCMRSMLMFTVCLFGFFFLISTSCTVFLLFFWLTLTSMIHAINVPFLSNLTFPSMSILLLPLFTSVCCKYITHCFDFYLFGCMFVSCT